MTYILKQKNGIEITSTKSKVRAYLMAWRHGWTVHPFSLRL